MTDILKVQQAAREAAAECLKAARDGVCDEQFIIQAFQRAINAERERAARIVDLEIRDLDCTQIRSVAATAHHVRPTLVEIAAAIRQGEPK